MAVACTVVSDFFFCDWGVAQKWRWGERNTCVYPQFFCWTSYFTGNVLETTQLVPAVFLSYLAHVRDPVNGPETRIALDVRRLDAGIGMFCRPDPVPVRADCGKTKEKIITILITITGNLFNN